jgi:hypothetical protein
LNAAFILLASTTEAASETLLLDVSRAESSIECVAEEDAVAAATEEDLSLFLEVEDRARELDDDTTDSRNSEEEIAFSSRTRV